MLCYSRLSGFAAALVVCPFFILMQTLPALAQIASPNNAGQNSGNNAFGSSFTSIGTARFSSLILVSLVSGVTVEPDGTVSGDPAVIDSIRRALREAVTRNPSVLEPVTQVTPPRLGDAPVVLLASASDLPVAAGPVQATVVAEEDVLVVTIAGEQMQFPLTDENRSALRSYVNQAIKAGFTPASLRLGAQLVSIGAPVVPTLELATSLQGLAAQPTLNALASGIAAFNEIVTSASPSLRSRLNDDQVFIAAGNALRAARSAMPDRP